MTRRTYAARSIRRIVGTMAAAAAVVAGSAAQAHAFSIESVTTSTSSTVAGSHPDVGIDLRFETLPNQDPAGNVRDLIIDLPVGLIGNPQQIPVCPDRDFYETNRQCPLESQVGEGILEGAPGSGEVRDFELRIYNLNAPDNEPARLGIKYIEGQHVPVQVLRFQVRTGSDYGLRTVSESVSRNIPIRALDLTMWGVPADHTGVGERRPFMTAPTECSTIPSTRVEARSWEDPNDWDTAVAVMDHAASDCESLPFDPNVTVRPHSRTIGAPTAVDVEINVPQNQDPDGRATAHLKDVRMQMPEGLTINPGTARDLSACSDAAFGAKSGGPAQCPAGSKIGTMGITTPLLPTPMPGDIYLGEPLSGNRFRLFLYAVGHGVRVKIPGSVYPDPQTGRLNAVFEANPQLPFNRLNLRFRGGNNAVLAMPMTCGTRTAKASMSSWAGHGIEATSSIQVYGDEEGSPCPERQPFAPTFVAGTTGAGGGSDTGLTLAFGRDDRDQELGGLRLSMPAGLLGRLAAFPLCPVAKVNANECGDESLVGGVTVSAGAGNSLLNLPGKIYLIEPFKEGQIAGLGIVVRAIAGPYDLGTVVVKNGIKVNPDTSLSVETDPLPTILEGIPLRLRQVQVNVDRPGFMFNPTDCSPKTITATLLSSSGAEAPVGSPFQLRGCGDLPFAPPMTISATAPAAGNTMGLEVNLGGIPGHANARQVQVVLPGGIGARLDGPIQTQCSEAQFASDSCPATSRIGNAEAVTPILPSSLKGDVYFVDNGKGGGLPRLGVRLKGLVQLDLVADVEVTRGGRISTTFPAVPDVPISNFRLSLDSGSQSVLTGGNVCGRKLLAERNMIAHNGRATNDRVPVTVNGCPANAASKKPAKKKGAKGKARQQRGA